jgi:hypothetical protein
MKQELIIIPRAAIDAFEKEIAGYLAHPAFSQFGVVSITDAEVRPMAEAWALDRPTEEEQRVMLETLAGESANKYRRGGIKLAVAAALHLADGAELLDVRRTMCGAPTDFAPPVALQPAAQAWRVVQVRQAFRLALEALLFWALRKLDDEPLTTAALVDALLKCVGDSSTTRQWLEVTDTDAKGPADWVDRLERSLSPLDEIGLLSAIK